MGERRRDLSPAGHGSAAIQSRSGRHSAVSADAPAAMPIWPAAGWCSTAPAISAASGIRALPAARCGRAPAPRRRLGSAQRRRIDRQPGDPPCAAAGRVGAVPAGQGLARHRRGQRHAVVQPVLQRHEQAGARAVRVEAGEAAVLRGDAERVEQREQHLQAHRPAACRPPPSPAPAAAAGAASRGGLLRVGGVEVPGRRQQRQGAHQVRPPQRRRQRQQPAHAVAGQHHRLAHATPAPAPAARRCSRSA